MKLNLIIFLGCFLITVFAHGQRRTPDLLEPNWKAKQAGHETINAPLYIEVKGNVVKTPKNTLLFKGTVKNLGYALTYKSVLLRLIFFDAKGNQVGVEEKTTIYFSKLAPSQSQKITIEKNAVQGAYAFYPYVILGNQTQE